MNHNGSLELAKRLVTAAALAGADAVKFQTFKTDELVTADAPKARYQRAATGRGGQREMLRGLELGERDFRALAKLAKEKKIEFLSTPFDEKSADMLDDIGVPAFKMASGELTNHPLLRHVAGKGKPMILSTGMSTMDEISEALEAVRGEGLESVAILHCVTSYPARHDELNLTVIPALKKRFGVPVGFSDHSLGTVAAVASVALGACIIEKHFTLDTAMDGPDHAASLPASELGCMVSAIRQAEVSLGDGRKAPTPSEKGLKRLARRGAVAAGPIRKGAKLGRGMVKFKRPATGIEPRELASLIGCIAKRDILVGESLHWKDFERGEANAGRNGQRKRAS